MWKEHFSEFWPAKSKFFAPLAGIAPGEVGALDLGMPGGLKLSTGVLERRDTLGAAHDGRPFQSRAFAPA